MQKFWKIIIILEEGIKHFFLVLAKQEKELFFSQLALKEL